MLAKYWKPGRVKTRLAATTRPEVAAALYGSFVSVLLRRFATIGDRRVLCFAPDEERVAFESIAGNAWAVMPQSTGSLGQRMSTFFNDAFAEGATRVVLIGSDSPTLPEEFIRRAYHLLMVNDVVLGPTTDGGYYLIGAREKTPPIFENVAWSTAAVWNQTMGRLRTTSLSYDQLPSWYDVDDQGDLIRLHDELSQLESREAWEAELLAVVAKAVG